MIGTVAVIDFHWYEFLSQRRLQQVNFWTPSPRRRFSAPEFSPVFFKLKAPHRAIAGFGYFARWSALPTWLAWECFDEGNGCEGLAEFENRLTQIRSRIGFVGTAPTATSAAFLLFSPRSFRKALGSDSQPTGTIGPFQVSPMT